MPDIVVRLRRDELYPVLSPSTCPGMGTLVFVVVSRCAFFELRKKGSRSSKTPCRPFKALGPLSRKGLHPRHGWLSFLGQALSFAFHHCMLFVLPASRQ